MYSNYPISHYSNSTVVFTVITDCTKVITVTVLWDSVLTESLGLCL